MSARPWRGALVAGALLVAVLAAALGLVRSRARPPVPSPTPGARAARPGNGLSVLLITIDTLRADHLGIYGYHRPTSPRIDALGRGGTVFDRAYTFWPKTRGSFVMMMTGRRPSQNGYSKTHQVLLEFNPTLASVLRDAGYRTAAVVDNPNVAAQHGYGKGFEKYRETWEEKEKLRTEMDKARAITEDGVRYVSKARPGEPFFLWLHYVNPHAPYTPPPPFDRKFLDAGAEGGPRLPVVDGFHGGIRKGWAVAGRDRLGYYVAQYDGEIAAVDQEVGRVLEALDASAVRDRTLVVLTSDHGESLGEHDYFFDHGEDLFDPSLEIPLIVRMPGALAGQRSNVFATTLDLVPTVLDAVKVSYPPDLAGISLLGAVQGGARPARERLFAQNDRNLTATWDARYKLVATPLESDQVQHALFDRARDPSESHDLSRSRPDDLRVQRRELELLFQERAEREWRLTRRLLEGVPGERPMTPEACEAMRALGYAGAGCS